MYYPPKSTNTCYNISLRICLTDFLAKTSRPDSPPFFHNSFSRAFLNNNARPTALRTIRARSFHMTEIISHRKMPTQEKVKSICPYPSIPRSDIPISKSTLATHFIYQSGVYFGVALLNIRLLCYSSSSVNFTSCSAISPPVF